MLRVAHCTASTSNVGVARSSSPLSRLMSTSSPPVKSCKPPVRALASGHVLDLPALLGLVPAHGGPQVGRRAPRRHTDDASLRLSELRAYRVESTHSRADPAEERVVHVPAWRRHPVERAGITLTASTLLLARDGGACKRGGGWWGVVGLGLGLGFGFGLRVARALARRHARVRCAAHA
jgi:hypothetical protein